jgi:hypothetical protein
MRRSHLASPLVAALLFPTAALGGLELRGFDCKKAAVREADYTCTVTLYVSLAVPGSAGEVSLRCEVTLDTWRTGDSTPQAARGESSVVLLSSPSGIASGAAEVKVNFSSREAVTKATIKDAFCQPTLLQGAPGNSLDPTWPRTPPKR